MKCLCRRKSTEVDRGQKENLLIIFWLKYRPGGKFGNEIKGQGRQRGIWAIPFNRLFLPECTIKDHLFVLFSLVPYIQESYYTM